MASSRSRDELGPSSLLHAGGYSRISRHVRRRCAPALPACAAPMGACVVRLAPAPPRPTVLAAPRSGRRGEPSRRRLALLTLPPAEGVAGHPELAGHDLQGHAQLRLLVRLRDLPLLEPALAHGSPKHRIVGLLRPGLHRPSGLGSRETRPATRTLHSACDAWGSTRSAGSWVPAQSIDSGPTWPPTRRRCARRLALTRCLATARIHA